MKSKLGTLALAFLALYLGEPLAAFTLCIVVIVLMIGDAMDLPACRGTCQQGDRACDCHQQQRRPPC